MRQGRKVLTRGLAVFVTVIGVVGGATASVSADSTAYPRESYCNVLDLTEACKAEFEEGTRRLLEEPIDGSRRAASCSVPEASMRDLGGTIPGHKRVQGYGYILCNASVPSLSITGSLRASQAQSQMQIGDTKLPIGAGDATQGGWTCLNTFLCMMSTQVANGYGVQVCYVLYNVGSTSEGYLGSKEGYDCF